MHAAIYVYMHVWLLRINNIILPNVAFICAEKAQWVGYLHPGAIHSLLGVRFLWLLCVSSQLMLEALHTDMCLLLLFIPTSDGALVLTVQTDIQRGGEELDVLPYGQYVYFPGNFVHLLFWVTCSISVWVWMCLGRMRGLPWKMTSE